MFVFQPPKIEYDPNCVVLIDGDILAYEASFGKDNRPTRLVDDALDDLVERIKNDCKAGHVIIYLTGKQNFRNDVACLKQYKGNRYNPDGSRKRPQPKHLFHAKDYLIKAYKAEMQEYQEADDALVIAQTAFNKSSGKLYSIISTIDKDLRICPGLHHNIGNSYIDKVTKLGKLIKNNKGKVKGAGLKFFYAQLLMGDDTDNIPGLPKVTEYMVSEYGCRRGGCGQVSAYKVLNSANSEYDFFKRVFKCYESYWEEQSNVKHWRTGETLSTDPVKRMEEQGQLLWMRTYENEMWEIPITLLDRYYKENKNES